MTDPLPPAGWYADAEGNAYIRYWAGERWSEHTAPAGSRPLRPDPGTLVALGAPPSRRRRALLAASLIS
jgi:hypothetical protein